MNRAKLLDHLYGRPTAEVAPHQGVRNHGKHHWRQVAQTAGELAELAGSAWWVSGSSSPTRCP